MEGTPTENNPTPEDRQEQDQAVGQQVRQQVEQEVDQADPNNELSEGSQPGQPDDPAREAEIDPIGDLAEDQRRDAEQANSDVAEQQAQQEREGQDRNF